MEHRPLRPQQPVPSLSRGLVAQLVGSREEFQTATAINNALGQLFALLAGGQFPVRKAAVLAYIAQLLLNTLPLVRKESRLSWRAQQRTTPEPATAEEAKPSRLARGQKE